MSQREPSLIGVVRPNGATIVSHEVEVCPDGSVVSTIVEMTPEGALQHEVTVTHTEDSEGARRGVLAERAKMALVSNATYLALGGDLEEQVRALTVQVDAVTRLVLGLFDAT